MLNWAFQIALQLAEANSEILGLSPGDSAQLPDVQTHYGHSTIKLRIIAERVDGIPHEQLPHMQTVQNLAQSVPPWAGVPSV